MVNDYFSLASIVVTTEYVSLQIFAFIISYKTCIVKGTNRKPGALVN